MSAVPPRESRVMLAAKAIKQDILSGDLSGYLPGERELAKRLRVGRVTVKGALDLLEQEQWVGGAKIGTRREIIKGGDAAQSTGGSPEVSLEGKTVVVLAQCALDHMPTYERLNHMRMVTYCANAGITLRYRDLDLSHFSRPGHRIKEFLKTNPAELYLLQLVSKEVQMWFDKNRVPSLILGSAWPGCRLPSVDLDQRALGVHAASLLDRMKHRDVGLLYPMPEKQGMRLFKEGFESVATKARLMLAPVEDTANSVEHGILSLMEMTEKRPSVLVLPRIPYVMAAITLLPTMELKVPHDVSLLCLVYDEEFEFFHPKVAGYQCSMNTYAKAAFAMIASHLRYPNSSLHNSVLLTPDFIKATSLQALA